MLSHCQIAEKVLPEKTSAQHWNQLIMTALLEEVKAVSHSLLHLPVVSVPIQTE
jgi:hypothetical protein